MSEQKNDSGVDKDNVDDIDIDLDNEADGSDDEGDKGKDDKKDEKKPDGDNNKETPEAKVARLQRQLKRAQRDAGIVDEEPKTKKTSENKELGYAEKAFLTANGIKGKDETTLVKDIMASTGKSLEDVLESKYFQAELKEIRETKASKDAIPSGSKRSNQSQATEVEYWLAKGELPPPDQRELRTKVVNARIKAQKSASQFTDTPVAGK